MTETAWYKSRKLWIAFVAAVLTAAVVLGGEALGVSPDLITSGVVGIGALAAMLMGTHAYTDARALAVKGHAQLVAEGRATRPNVAEMIGALAPLLSSVLPNPSVATTNEPAPQATMPSRGPETVEETLAEPPDMGEGSI
jgi:hypothetical protein